MNYQLAPPSGLLSDFVKHYWTIEKNFESGEEFIQRIVPSGLTELMFHLGDKPETSNENLTIEENTVICCQLNTYYDIKVSGKLSLFSILFKPQGISMFFDLPISEFKNANVPLRFILKGIVNDLESKLFDEPTFFGRIQIVEKFLLESLNKVRKKHHFNRIND